jgi:hypothetical protein
VGLALLEDCQQVMALTRIVGCITMRRDLQWVDVVVNTIFSGIFYE